MVEKSTSRVGRTEVEDLKRMASLLVGSGPEREESRRALALAEQSHHPVLIMGEGGTGKEVVARAVHASRENSGQPFIAVDCDSPGPTALAGELFGCERGAFPGAARSRSGLLATAGGTVFFSETQKLPLAVQSRLARTLDERQVCPIGSRKAVPLRIAVMASFSRDPEGAMAKGAFRRDLFFRLNILSILIPPLREHKQDLPAIVDLLLQRSARSTGIEWRLEEAAMAAIVDYDWPGNLRELQNFVERACALSPSAPFLRALELPALGAETSFWGNAKEGPDIVPLAELEREAILSALERLNGDVLLAARMLGVGKTTIYRKLREFGVTSDNPRRR